MKPLIYFTLGLLAASAIVRADGPQKWPVYECKFFDTNSWVAGGKPFSTHGHSASSATCKPQGGR